MYRFLVARLFDRLEQDRLHTIAWIREGMWEEQSRELGGL